MRPRLPIALLLVAVGCRPPAESGAPVVDTLPNPAPVGSAQAGLAQSPTGRLILSWQVRQPDSSLTLHFAQFDSANGGWLPVRDVPTGSNMLASSTDVPGVVELRSGALTAAWRGKHGTRGYDILLAHSTDGGATWSPPRSPHRDSTLAEHGFVSWVQVGDTTGLVWVDGRATESADTANRATALTYAALDSAGAAGPESVLDPWICDCCHTASAPVPGGVVVVYRNRTRDDIRDIGAIRWTGGRWRDPVMVHDDDWHIRACPVNGPAVAAAGARVAVAWFTMAHDTARVRLAFSTDTATSFGPPIEINDGPADGKVGVALAPNGDALVSWIERRDGNATLRIRRVTPTGGRSPAVEVAAFGAGKRAGGMPKLVAAGTGALLAWTDPASNRIRTARIRLP